MYPRVGPAHCQLLFVALKYTKTPLSYTETGILNRVRQYLDTPAVTASAV